MNRVIFIDVDDTLVRSFGSKHLPISHMVKLVRDLKEHGANLFCWSSGGADYARSIAREYGLEDCFTSFLPKPNVMLDDVLVENWRLTQLHPNECLSMTPDEIFSKTSS